MAYKITTEEQARAVAERLHIIVWQNNVGWFYAHPVTKHHSKAFDTIMLAVQEYQDLYEDQETPHSN